MQEIKVDIIPNNPGFIAQYLKQLIRQGYHIDAYSTEKGTSQTTVTSVVSRRNE